MTYTVINEELKVEDASITFITTSSVFFVGDIKTISLATAFDSPPEEEIVGVTIPLLE
ncbi:MAG: spore gernimation protein GerPD [Bacillaceae bacterium]|nr:spore gernimation protein GerPD [Bacillaceae bacterium]